MYDISTSKTTQITTWGCAENPSIYNNKIVYEDSHAAGTANYELGSIYLYDLTAKLAKPTATFASNAISGTHPLTVLFSYIENGDMPTSYLWNFGDGKTSTHALTATHTYIKAGTYTVSLKVSNSAGSNTATKTKYILVK